MVRKLILITAPRIIARGLEGRELKAKSRILRRHGRMTAEEESRKTKQKQGEGGIGPDS